jgi:hypothetical protein
VASKKIGKMDKGGKYLIFDAGAIDLREGRKGGRTEQILQGAGEPLVNKKSIAAIAETLFQKLISRS